MRAKYRRVGASTAVMFMLVTACGGGSSSTSVATSPPATTAPATSVAATTVAPTTTAPPTTVATTSAAPATTAAGGGDAELIAAGEVLYQTTAGGVGCAVCHTPEATGNPELASPDIRGADFTMISNALAERAQMSTLRMSNDEIKAVAAYLATLDVDG